MPKILIVGAGVIGTALAYQLSVSGAEVVVVDSGEAGEGTSASSFAWVNSNDKAPAPYARLNNLGLQTHIRWSSELRGARWFHQTGNLEVAQTPEELSLLEQKVTRHVQRDYRAEMVSKERVLELEPNIDISRVVGGAFFPEEGWVDTENMCSDLLDRAMANGAIFKPFTRVTNVGEGFVDAELPSGEQIRLDGDLVVLAAGNGVRGILQRQGIDFPILEPATTTRDDNHPNTAHPTVGLISTTTPVPARITHIIRADGVSIRPAPNGGYTFTDHPTAGQWSRTDSRIWTIPDIFLKRAQELFPILERASIEAVTLGTRVLPHDGLTIADWLLGSSTIYVVSTHSGVSIAPHLAEVVASEILTGNRHESLGGFDLKRFN